MWFLGKTQTETRFVSDALWDRLWLLQWTSAIAVCSSRLLSLSLSLSTLVAIKKTETGKTSILFFFAKWTKPFQTLLNAELHTIIAAVGQKVSKSFLIIRMGSKAAYWLFYSLRHILLISLSVFCYLRKPLSLSDLNSLKHGSFALKYVSVSFCIEVLC